MGWHLAHPHADNIDERKAICGSDEQAFGMWEKWKDRDSLCTECAKLHKERLRDLGRRLLKKDGPHER